MKYSVIHWGYSNHGKAGHSWITYSKKEHREAMATIRALGGKIHDWH